MLIGTSTEPGAFTEEIVRDDGHARRPADHLAAVQPDRRCPRRCPADLIRWTDGRALVATGSPFAPVTYEGITYPIAQANNALVFPGLGLGVIVARASRVTDGMLAAAAEAVAGTGRRHHAGRVAAAAGGQPAKGLGDGRGRGRAGGGSEGLAQVDLTNPVQQVQDAMWRPAYPKIELA